MSNILLIGFMGSGKSTVSRLLAEKLSFSRVDLDDEVEKTQGKTISEIFETEGEEKFRDYETQSLEKYMNKKNKVIATGGGVIKRERNVNIMKGIGLVVFLHADKEQLLSNLKGSTDRPLLKDVDIEAKVDELLGERDSLYMNAANVIIQTTGKTPDEVVEEIIQFL